MERRGVIVLDTHIWIWWVNQSRDLTDIQRRYIAEHQPDGIGITAISCWEVAKLVERGRLALTISVLDWVEQALQYPGVRLLDLSPRVAVESTRLPGTFHRDPADQIIVATARVHNCALLTADLNILAYPHVRTLQ